MYTGAGSVDEAFRNLVSQALHECGHDPYNGTISTSSGYKMVSSNPVLPTQAHKIADDAAESLEKWGNWIAIPVCQAENIHQEVEVSLRGAEAAGSDQEVFAALQKKAIQKALARRKGWVGVEAYVSHWHRTLKNPKVVRPQPAKAVWVVDLGMRHAQKVFDTKAEALEYAKSVVNAAPQSGKYIFGLEREVTVEKQFRSLSGSRCKISVRAENKTVTATVTVKLERPAASQSTVGWLFAGWAAC